MDSDDDGASTSEGEEDDDEDEDEDEEESSDKEVCTGGAANIGSVAEVRLSVEEEDLGSQLQALSMQSSTA